MSKQKNTSKNVSRPKNPLYETATVEEDYLDAVIAQLRDRNSKLQMKIDIEGENLLKNLFINSINDAMNAQDFYNSEWFANNLYSPEINIKIAQKLIEQTASYPINDDAWQNIASPKDRSNEESINDDFK